MKKVVAGESHFLSSGYIFKYLLFDFKDIPKRIKKRSMNIWFKK